jgi:hypothetical protein
MINQWVLEAIGTNAVVAEQLPQERVQKLLGLIVHRYAAAEHDDRCLWERFQNDVARRRADGWNLICQYATQRPILLFRDDDQFFGYDFIAGDDLRVVLKNCPGFEFYVTNDAVDYVLCHNHHDYLIGVGACRSWISTLADQDAASNCHQ